MRAGSKAVSGQMSAGDKVERPSVPSSTTTPGVRAKGGLTGADDSQKK